MADNLDEILRRAADTKVPRRSFLAAAGLLGGSAALAVDAGSRASLSFTGSGVSWITYEDQWSGVARVYIDGELKTTVDEYASPARIGVAAYTIGGLSPGAHTITIEATGSRNASSQGA